MRLLRTAVMISGLVILGIPAGAHADFPTRTHVVVKVGQSVEREGSGVIRVRPHVEGDPVLCTGTIRLVIRHAGEVVVKRSKPIPEVKNVRFRVKGLEEGRHQVTGEYRIGDKDPCDVSKDRVRIQVR